MRVVITENQLRALVENAVDKITPIIDYVKSFGQKGKLPPFNGAFANYYQDAMRTAYEWACESTPGVSRDGFASFMRDFCVNILGNLTLNKRNLIYVERSIDLDTSKDSHDSGFKSVGECWSWKKHNAKSYCADFSLTDSNAWNVVLCGYVHPDSIDWVETIYLNSYRMKNETEIRLNDNALVEVSYIKVNGNVYRLNGSYLLDASADKYKKI